MRLVFFVSSLLIAASAFAQQSQTTVLSHVQIDGQETTYTALLTVDQEEGIQVEIVNDICGKYKPADGLMHCMAMPAPIQSLSVPLQTVKESCGSKIYSGTQDLRPVDGAKTSIKVMDHSTRVCMDLQPSSLVVQAKVDSLRGESHTYLLTR